MMIEKTVGHESPNQFVSTDQSLGSVFGSEGASFEAVLKNALPSSDRASIDVESLVGAEPIPDLNESGEPMGRDIAKILTKILDNVGFLDRVVESLVRSSENSEWVSDGMRADLKFVLMKKLQDVVLPSMTWSEAMNFIMQLKLKIKYEEFRPLSLDSEGARSGSIHDKLESDLMNHIDDLADAVRGVPVDKTRP